MNNNTKVASLTSSINSLTEEEAKQLLEEIVVKCIYECEGLNDSETLDEVLSALQGFGIDV